MSHCGTFSNSSSSSSYGKSRRSDSSRRNRLQKSNANNVSTDKSETDDDAAKRELIKKEYLELYEDLVGNTPETRNWRGLIFAILTICFVISLVAIAVFLLTPPKQKIGSIDITLDTIRNSRYKPRDLHFQFLNDGSFVYMNSKNDIVRQLSLDSEPTILLKSSDVDLYQIEDFSVSHDASYLVIKNNIQPLHKHSTTFHCSVLWVKKMKRIVLYPQEEVQPLFQLCDWTPLSNKLVVNAVQRGLLIATLRDETIHIEILENYTQSRFTGVTDFLYEVEILRSQKALWFSNINKWFVYAIFDDLNVSVADFPPFIGYEETDILHYVKIGRELPLVSLVVYNYETHQSVSVQLTLKGDSYLVSVSTSENVFAASWISRDQMEQNIIAYSAQNGTILLKTFFEKVEGFTEQLFPPLIEDDTFIYLPKTRRSKSSSFTHIYKKKLDGASDEGSLITEGYFDVSKMLGTIKSQNKSKLLYFSTEDSVLSREIYEVDASLLQVSSRCVSCGVFGNDCKYFDAKLSFNGELVYINCLGPSYPKQFIAQASNFSNNIVLEDNKETTKQMDELKMSNRNFYNLSNGDHYTEIELLTPPIVDLTHEYPLLVWINHPNELEVSYKWRFNYANYLASSLHILVAFLNYQGLSYKGETFRKSIIDNPGSKEAEDIIKSISFLKKESRIVDSSSVGIYSEGYGSYIAVQFLETAVNPIKCSVMVNPLINLSTFNAHFVERLFTFSDYTDLQSKINDNAHISTDNMRNTKTLIVHGMAEEEFPFENSATLMNEYTKNNILFYSQIYTTASQNLFRKKVNKHLEMKITDFLKMCLID